MKKVLPFIVGMILSVAVFAFWQYWTYGRQVSETFEFAEEVKSQYLLNAAYEALDSTLGVDQVSEDLRYAGYTWGNNKYNGIIEVVNLKCFKTRTFFGIELHDHEIYTYTNDPFNIYAPLRFKDVIRLESETNLGDIILDIKSSYPNGDLFFLFEESFTYDKEYTFESCKDTQCRENYALFSAWSEDESLYFKYQLVELE